MGEEKRVGGDLWSLSERYGEIPLGLGLAKMEGGGYRRKGEASKLAEAAWDSDIEVLEAVGGGGGGGGMKRGWGRV
jgi:hypothetical protein